MTKLSFLNKLKLERKLELVESSEEISTSYIIKSENCIKVARLAFEAGIYENAVSEAYYSIYNIVTALFYKCGIKCENHSAAVILVKELFGLDSFHSIFSEFKKDRIDYQYYTPTFNNDPIDTKMCNENLRIAQQFTLELRAYMEKLTLEDIKNIRKKFDLLK